MNILRIPISIIVIILSLTNSILAQDSQQDRNDILGEILSDVGFTRTDLGYQPKGYWNRFPLDIPYKLTSFNDLFAEPMKLYDYATVMANTVELYMEPSYSDSADDGLYKLVYNLGVDKRLGGFRSYSSNQLPPPTGDRPLISAVEQLYHIAGENWEQITFGSKYESPQGKKEFEKKLEILPDSVRVIISTLVTNLGDAIKWHKKAFRNSDYQTMQRVFSIRDLADTQSDGTKYYSEIDDLAATIDWASLHYATLKVADATEKAELGLTKYLSKMKDKFLIEVATPFGKVLLINKETDNINLTNSLLVISFNGDNLYSGNIAATSSLENPLSVMIDLSGNDVYGKDKRGESLSCGVGVCGVGVLLDSKGNDNYFGATFAQGAGFFGSGILLDRAGNDNYNSQLSSQGCGYFGIGLCFDISGDDTFYLYGDGQGMGGVGGGVGVLASYGGKDKYTAEPYSKVFNRGDYHSKSVINGNNAQGAGFGRRGDGSDGHSWAGGLGVIIDINGDDHYYGGNWTLGVGYWFATGIAIDRNGNDLYESCYFTQGSGAHYCNGILIDNNGDDKHHLFETAGAAFGFGWDYTNAFLINIGGDDSYKAKIISIGLAQIRSCAFLIDIGGDDSYQVNAGTPSFGEATFRSDYKIPSKLTPYYYYAKSFGGFIDIGGQDTYWQIGEDDKLTTHIKAQNNFKWFSPNKSDSTYGSSNFGVGIDIELGDIPEFSKWLDN